MSNALATDVPIVAHSKAVRAIEEFNAIVAQYEMLLDTQQVLVRTANFAALFEMASRGDTLARNAANCGKRFTPLVNAVAAGQFVGPRATEIHRRSFAANSRAQTISGSASRLATACAAERDTMGLEIRRSNTLSCQAGLPPAYCVDTQPLLDRRA